MLSNLLNTLSNNNMVLNVSRKLFEKSRPFNVVKFHQTQFAENIWWKLRNNSFQEYFWMRDQEHKLQIMMKRHVYFQHWRGAANNAPKKLVRYVWYILTRLGRTKNHDGNWWNREIPLPASPNTFAPCCHTSRTLRLKLTISKINKWFEGLRSEPLYSKSRAHVSNAWQSLQELCL